MSTACCAAACFSARSAAGGIFGWAERDICLFFFFFMRMFEVEVENEVDEIGVHSGAARVGV